MSLFELLGSHERRQEDSVVGVVAGPIAVQQPALGFELIEEWSAGKRSEDVEGGGLKLVLNCEL